jgi:hypothetical protein
MPNIMRIPASVVTVGLRDTAKRSTNKSSYLLIDLIRGSSVSCILTAFILNVDIPLWNKLSNCIIDMSYIHVCFKDNYSQSVSDLFLLLLPVWLRNGIYTLYAFLQKEIK